MKQALTTCIRSTGTHTYRAGLGYFRLAERQFGYGDRDEARDNYAKARLNMEGLQQQGQEYTICVYRLACLELYEGSAEKCIQHAIRAIKAA